MSRSLLGADAVCTADCLGPCGNSNVVVVLLPSAAGRCRGGRPVWLGFVPSRESLDDITGWIGAGGLGLAAIPDTVDLHRIAPPPP